MNTITDFIKRRVRAKRRGWVFTPKDFLDVGPRAAVDQALSRLTKQGLIRRLDRGFYDFPKQHPMLGALSPSSDSLAQAITAQRGDKLFPSGAAAANFLGLSTQVPAKSVYLTDGATRTKKVAGRTIAFKHANVPLLDRLSVGANSVLQALSYLGKGQIDDAVIQQCARLLAPGDLKKMTVMAPKMPGWLADVIQKIAQKKNGSIRQNARGGSKGYPSRSSKSPRLADGHP